jgi:hypothetical protein
VTIYRNLLARGYFPKELPPSFFTEQFAQYATSKRGRLVINSYKPSDNFTECFAFRLALPNLQRRHLHTPHPYSFAVIAQLTAKHFRRLLKKAAASPFSKSRPIYKTGRHRGLHTMMNPANLARERAALRGGASFLVKVDISQFYPSLYTHAVGWAIDPKLRKRAHWGSRNLLGKALDQNLMNLQGKISQGVPIGNDVSFLLAEIVLAQIDRKLRVAPSRAYRWYDDYEIACDSREDAEEILARLILELGAFRLRVNPIKTAIVPLPIPSQQEWQQILREQSEANLNVAQNMVQYFDTSFRLRDKYPDSPVLLYALGILFKLRCPNTRSGEVAFSAITQTLLAEPGASQKAFSLLTYWKLNGFSIDADLIAQTVEQMILRHRSLGVSSDISWALAFCIENQIVLGKRAGKTLSVFEDDCVGIQTLHAHSLGLLPKGFTTRRLSRLLKGVDLEGEHWLLGYEAFRQGFLTDSEPAVKANPLFMDLYSSNVTFYRRQLPLYASIIHPGGAPEWVVASWIRFLQLKRITREAQTEFETRPLPIIELIKTDFEQVPEKDVSVDDAISELLDLFEPKIAELIPEFEPYVG